MELTCSVQDDILVVKFSGMLIEREISDTLEQYIETVRSSGLKKVLVDTRDLRGRLSIIEVYLHTRTLPPPDHSIKTAIVENEENKRYAEFQDLFLKNKGHISTQFFFDLDEAMAWLKE